MKRIVLLFVALIFVSGASSARAFTLTFNTSDNQFTAGIDNQGWWSATAANENINSNYFTGIIGGARHRSFFTFDFASLLAGTHVVTNARLELRRFSSSSGNEATETLEYFDVSTSAAILNNNSGTNAGIFNDLGTGISYGSFGVPGSGGINVLVFNLNAAALTDINNSFGGFFSIGGSLTSQNGDDWLYGGSGNFDPQRLVLEVTVIPEPSTIALFGFGLVGMVVFLRKRRKA